MVPWWKRLVYSLGSVVVGAGVSGALVSAKEFVTNAHGHLSAMGLTVAVLDFDCWVVILSLPGWMLAIPIVLMVRNISGWRFWIYWVLGSCFGPMLVLGIALYSAVRAANFEAFPGNAASVVYLAGAISCLTTLLYLLLLRRGQTLAMYKMNESAV